MEKFDVVITGAGFTGLAMGYYLSKQGKRVHIIEADSISGGLAGNFKFSDGIEVEKFYHHWFNNDTFALELIRELGLESDIIRMPSRTGMLYKGKFWKLSSPLDLLKFRAIPFIDRLRLGLLVFRVRQIKDWKAIEHLSIREWLEPICGKSAYKVVWEPLINAKFSCYAEDINAVWMWNKLVLRGSTRNSKGNEELLYFKGGFGRLTEALVTEIKKYGGEVSFNQMVTDVELSGTHINAVVTNKSVIQGDKFIFTQSLPTIADIFTKAGTDSKWISSLKRVNYLVSTE